MVEEPNKSRTLWLKNLTGQYNLLCNMFTVSYLFYFLALALLIKIVLTKQNPLNKSEGLVARKAVQHHNSLSLTQRIIKFTDL